MVTLHDLPSVAVTLGKLALSTKTLSTRLDDAGAEPFLIPISLLHSPERRKVALFTLILDDAGDHGRCSFVLRRNFADAGY